MEECDGIYSQKTTSMNNERRNFNAKKSKQTKRQKIICKNCSQY